MDGMIGFGMFIIGAIGEFVTIFIGMSTSWQYKDATWMIPICAVFMVVCVIGLLLIPGPDTPKVAGALVLAIILGMWIYLSVPSFKSPATWALEGAAKQVLSDNPKVTQEVRAYILFSGPAKEFQITKVGNSFQQTVTNMIGGEEYWKYEYNLPPQGTVFQATSLMNGQNFLIGECRYEGCMGKDIKTTVVFVTAYFTCPGEHTCSPLTKLSPENEAEKWQWLVDGSIGLRNQALVDFINQHIVDDRSQEEVMRELGVSKWTVVGFDMSGNPKEWKIPTQHYASLPGIGNVLIFVTDVVIIK